jgi:hypothetical protein
MQAFKNAYKMMMRTPVEDDEDARSTERFQP